MVQRRSEVDLQTAAEDQGIVIAVHVAAAVFDVLITLISCFRTYVPLMRPPLRPGSPPVSILQRLDLSDTT